MLTIANFDVKRILVDNRSSTDILYYDAFQKMKLACSQLQSISTSLVRFTRSSVPVEGAINLPITIGTGSQQRIVKLTFLVVKVPSAYNVILRRPGLNAFRAIVSTYLLLIKFPTPSGIEEVRGDQMLAR